MKQGIIRRIGTDETTAVWVHNWIPRVAMLRPIASLVPNPPQLVCDFIDSTSAVWKKDLVRLVFIPIYAVEYLKIPLCTTRVEDFWAWNEDKRGIYSVRSAYKMVISPKLSREDWINESEGQSNSSADQKGWSNLWKLCVPAKIKVLAPLPALLPTFDLLHHRHMATTNVCNPCGAVDSWGHALLDCSMARSVWALTQEEMVDQMSTNHNRMPTSGYLLCMNCYNIMFSQEWL
jgi:hypothetical protein